jgi:hypothetical protein
LDFDTILYANLEDFFFSLEDGKKSMELGSIQEHISPRHVNPQDVKSGED